MQRFDPLIFARPSSQTASPTSPHASHRQSSLNILAIVGVSLSSCSQSLARTLALNLRFAAHVPLGATQQSHQLAHSSLAPLAYASLAPPALSLPIASPAHLAPFLNHAVSSQWGLLLTPLTYPPLSSLSSVAQFPSHLQYL